MNATQKQHKAERMSRMGLLAEPAGYVDGMNLYEFVTSNPTNLVDPLGLQSAPPGPDDKGKWVDDDRFEYDDPKFRDSGFKKIYHKKADGYYVVADNGDYVHKCPYPGGSNSFHPGKTGVAGKDGKSEEKKGAYYGDSKNRFPDAKRWTGGVQYSYDNGKLRVVVRDQRDQIIKDISIDPPKSPEDFPNPEDLAK